MRVLLASIIGSLLVASPALADKSGDPVRFWSVSKVQQGAGVVPVADGSQVGGALDQYAQVGRVVFNLPLHAPFWYSLPRNDAFGAAHSNESGDNYSVLAQAPSRNPYQPGSPDGGVAQLDQYQAYVKRDGDASLRVVLSDLLLQTIDDNDRLAAWECPDGATCDPVRAAVHVHVRAYAASAGGDFFTAGGAAYLRGHQHSWQPGAWTTADSPGPLWGENDFAVDGDADASGSGAAGAMFMNHAIRLRIPLGAVKTGELFAVHVSLEADATDERGFESASQAFVQDPTHLLQARGLQRRGAPTFKEPHAKPLAAAHCTGSSRRAGVLQLLDATASESDPATVVVTRTGGSRGPASAGVKVLGKKTTVRFADGDTSARVVEVPAHEDAVVTPPRTFAAELTNVRCAKPGAHRRATVSVVDDDTLAPAAPPVQTPAPTATPTPTPAPPPPGLDPTFGPDGRVSGPSGQGEAVVIQPSGEIAVAGKSGQDVALARYDTHGHFDGVTTTDLGGDADALEDAAVLPDGGIVAAGHTDAHGILDTDFALVRYRADGSVDHFVTTDLGHGGDVANAVAVQPDGKILVAGSTVHGINSDVALARYNPDLTLDDGFGTHGIVTTDLGTLGDFARAIALQPDGGIVIAGGADEDVALVRYTADGHVDQSFGIQRPALGIGAVARDVALTPGGEIEIAGYVVVGQQRDFLLARFHADGSLDKKVTTDLGHGDDYAEGLAVDASGRTILVGRATSATILDMALVRYDADLSPDPSLHITADISGIGDFGEDLALDPAGRIVAAGYGGSSFALIRANP